MENVMILAFIVGYVCIAMEHKLQVNKAASALMTAGVLWVIYIMSMPLTVPEVNGAAFSDYLGQNPGVKNLPLVQQCIKFIVDFQIIESLGEVSETLFFLIGAMTIVELIDIHGGFAIITNRITTRKKKRLLWMISLLTFFMSAVLDNMTTAIVMVMLIRRIVPNYKERWIFASLIIIAANSGGAWSPIGDVTTIMLWVKGNVSTTPLISSLFLPSLVSVVIPAYLASRMLKGEIVPNDTIDPVSTNIEQVLTPKERTVLFFLGIICLLMVPVFKSVTHLPPFMGVMVALAIMWIYTEILYRRKVNVEDRYKHRVTQVMRRIDMPTILFFLGILMAVSALQSTGLLNDLGTILNEKLHNVYAINLIIGFLSSVVDNVPLVAGAIGMYPVADPSMVSTMADPAFMQHFVPDGAFWLALAYCAGVGGSMLIIGSVAGVVVMGIEKMNFMWYFKNISLIALLGYLGGMATLVLMEFLRTGAL